MAKVAYIGGLLLALFADDWKYAQEHNGVPISGLYGIYEVTAFVRNGTPVPPLLTEGARWRWIAARKGRWTVRAVDDSVQSYETKDEAKDHAFTIFKKEEPEMKYEVSYTQSDDGQFIFRTTMNGEALVATARKVDESKFLLLSRGFHWRNETRFDK